MGVRVPPLATLAGRSNVKVQLEELSPIVRRLTVELPPVRVDEALADAYRSLGRTVKIRGFRPGKAPRRILEELYKDQVERDVSTRLVEGSLAGALAEKAIAAVATPVIEQDRLMQGQPYRYRALIEVMPKIEPKDYRGLSLVAKGAAAGDDAVEAELARIRESLATLDPVPDRKVALEGDVAIIDYDFSGLPEGAPKAEGNRDTAVEVAPGSILAGFLVELKGVEIGQRIDVPVAFPVDHPVEKLRGVQATCRVTLKALRRRDVPALDDEMVKDLDEPGLTTLSALRARIGQRLAQAAEAEAAHDRREQIVAQLLEKNRFEAPTALIDRAAEGMLRRIAERIVEAGADPKELRVDQAKLRAMAEQRIKGEMILAAIADREGITVGEPEVDAYLEKVARDEEVPLAKAKARFARAPARAALVAKLREEKTLAFLAAEANIDKGQP